MVPANSLAALLNTHMDARGWSIAEAARRTGLSYRQMHRLLKGDSNLVKESTIEALEKLGLDRQAIVWAAHEGFRQKRVVTKG